MGNKESPWETKPRETKGEGTGTGNKGGGHRHGKQREPTGGHGQRETKGEGMGNGKQRGRAREWETKGVLALEARHINRRYHKRLIFLHVLVVSSCWTQTRSVGRPRVPRWGHRAAPGEWTTVLMFRGHVGAAPVGGEGGSVLRMMVLTRQS